MIRVESVDGGLFRAEIWRDGILLATSTEGESFVLAKERAFKWAKQTHFKVILPPSQDAA